MSTENIKDDNVPTLDVATADHGDVTVHADQLPTVTMDELKMLGMSRDELLRCFAEGAKLMADYTASDRVRPVASQTLDGKWEVRIVHYSELSDPLMRAAMVQTMRRWSGSYDQSRGSLSRAKPTNIRVDRQAAPTCGQPV